MKVGIVAPIKHLNLCTTDLNLCYSTLLTNSTYLDFYKRKEGITILDSSPTLPRKSYLDELLLGVKLINPTLIILPSIDYSWMRTASLVEEFLRGKKFKQELVGVVQGVNLDTLNKCYSLLKNNCSIIGLPSPLETIARREEIIRDLGIKEKVIYIEVYANPYEEVPPTSSMGICTSYPIRLAIGFRKLEEFSPTPPPLDFYKEEIVEELVKANIDEYLEVIRYAGSKRQYLGLPR